jgi:hypothetical protein
MKMSAAIPGLVETSTNIDTVPRFWGFLAALLKDLA